MSNKRTTYHHGNLREALILETEKMLDEHLLHHITLQRLGKRLGVATSAAYRHFSNKNDLLYAVATRSFERYKHIFQNIRLDHNLDTATRFRQMGKAYVEFAISHPDYYKLMYREPLIGDNETSELEQARNQVFNELLLILQQCQEDHLIEQRDLTTQALLIWSSIHGLCSLVIDKHLAPQQYQADTVDFFLNSLFHGLRKQT
ncbi:MAG TPA: TetR/AcrR family transcriptional regulator [Thiothrix sp.]|nr:TetR/AcrR family transcriptional regulator [Thiothrix sp.]